MAKLGELGAMGNQLFQYAALFGISQKKGYEMKIPPPPGLVDGDLKVLGHYSNQTPIERYDYALGCFKITSKYLSTNEMNKLSIFKKDKYKLKNKIWKKSIIKYNYFETSFNFKPQRILKCFFSTF